MTDPELKAEALTVDLIANANETAKKLKDCTEEQRSTLLAKHIRESDIALGVWEDEKEPDKIGLQIIKGEPLLRRAIAANETMKPQMAGIPCREYDEAMAFRADYGDGSLN